MRLVLLALSYAIGLYYLHSHTHPWGDQAVLRIARHAIWQRFSLVCSMMLHAVRQTLIVTIARFLLTSSLLVRLSHAWRLTGAMSVRTCRSSRTCTAEHHATTDAQ